MKKQIKIWVFYGISFFILYIIGDIITTSKKDALNLCSGNKIYFHIKCWWSCIKYICKDGFELPGWFGWLMMVLFYGILIIIIWRIYSKIWRSDEFGHIQKQEKKI